MFKDLLGRKNVRLYLLIDLLSQVGMSIIGPIYIIYIKNFGIDLAWILIPNLVFHTTRTLSEYPTGFLADKYGKKKSALLGLLLLVVSITIYGFGSNLWYFCVAEFVGAIGLSFLSGSLEQWLQEQEGPSVTTQTQSLAGVLSKIGTISSIAILGWFYIPNLAIYYFLSGGVIFLAFVATLFIAQDKLDWHHSSTLAAAKSHFQEFSSNPKVVKMTLYEGLRSIVEGAGIFMFWTLFFTEVKSMTLQDMFYVSALIQVGLMAGSLIALRSGLAKSISYTKILGAKGLILGSMLLVPSWVAVALFVVYEALESIMRLKFADLVNHQVQNSQNATSIRSLIFFFASLGKAFGMATMGLVATTLGVSGLWLFVAVVLVLLALSRFDFVAARFFALK